MMLQIGIVHYCERRVPENRPSVDGLVIGLACCGRHDHPTFPREAKAVPGRAVSDVGRAQATQGWERSHDLRELAEDRDSAADAILARPTRQLTTRCKSTAMIGSLPAHVAGPRRRDNRTKCGQCPSLAQLFDFTLTTSLRRQWLWRFRRR